ncbi:MAG: glycosyltransferase, partial [Desulfobacterales bacterium]
SDALIWAGVRKDMTSVYNALDISTSSSFFGEGFPNIIGESMSCGIPCVVTDVGDSAYAIGKTGVRVPKNNPERLAEGWQSLLSQNTSQWQEIKRKARQRIIENFSVQELIAKTEKILLSGN